jgi:hypothetical protein
VSALNVVQWPAMAVTVWAAWLAASSQRRRRQKGFWLYLASNILWVVWGVHAQAYALITLQALLAVMNIRGERRNSLQGRSGDPGVNVTGSEGMNE